MHLLFLHRSTLLPLNTPFTTISFQQSSMRTSPKCFGDHNYMLFSSIISSSLVLPYSSSVLYSPPRYFYPTLLMLDPSPSSTCSIMFSSESILLDIASAQWGRRNTAETLLKGPSVFPGHETWISIHRPMWVYHIDFQLVAPFRRDVQEIPASLLIYIKRYYYIISIQTLSIRKHLTRLHAPVVYDFWPSIWISVRFV